ncbi:hypothetical protein [Citreimonas salinaria]|nr:hypothetical protein [Citreimonas salinaria]
MPKQVRPSPDSAGAPGEPGPPTTHILRAVWNRLCEIERRVSDSLLGDSIAGICIVVLACAATVLVPLIFGH